MYFSKLLVLMQLLISSGIEAAVSKDAEVEGGAQSQNKKGTRKLSKSRKAGKNCERRTKAKSPKSCKGVDIYSGLPDSLVPPSATATLLDINRCLNALGSSGFDVLDVVNYDKWFDESSILLVADTGVFVGPEDIKEYIEISTTSEEYVFEKVVSDPTTVQILPIKAEGNECIITTSIKLSISTYQLNSPIDAILASRLTFNILEDPSKLLVHRVDIYAPIGFWGHIFEATYGEDFARRTCETMRDSCPSIFSNNCYTAGELDECIADMLSLTALDEGARLDGKGFGCRVIHAFLAAKNNKHCPHISFDPEYDQKCRLKCQESKGITNEDMFHPAELAWIAQHAMDLDLGPKQWKETSTILPTRI